MPDVSPAGSPSPLAGQAGCGQLYSIITPLLVPSQATTVSYSCPRHAQPQQSISQQGRIKRADGIAEWGVSTASLAHGVLVGTPPPTTAAPSRDSALPVARSR